MKIMRVLNIKALGTKKTGLQIARNLKLKKMTPVYVLCPASTRTRLFKAENFGFKKKDCST